MTPASQLNAVPGANGGPRQAGIFADMKQHTYQDLASRWGVCVRTVQRWFEGRKAFRPTSQTVRFTDKQIETFEQERQRLAAKPKRGKCSTPSKKQ